MTRSESKLSLAAFAPGCLECFRCTESTLLILRQPQTTYHHTHFVEEATVRRSRQEQRALEAGPRAWGYKCGLSSRTPCSGPDLLCDCGQPWGLLSFKENDNSPYP